MRIVRERIVLPPVDHVKGFGEINRHGQRAGGGAGLVEILGYMCKKEEDGNGGVVGTEAMLGG